MTKANPVIEFKDVSFAYSAPGDRPIAIEDINLTIYEGEYVALLGLNGAGKTTLQLCINGVIPNSIMGEFTGEVIVYGNDTFDTPVREMAKLVGQVFDNPEFQLSQMSVEEEIALGMESMGFSYAEMVETIPQVLETVGLSGLEKRSPFALSGGQQQRLSIASALAMRPRILVMDEPTSNVDPIGKEEIFAVAAKLNKSEKMTVVMAEHEVEVMAAYADRIIVLHEGKILLNGTPSEVFANSDVIEGLGLRTPQVTALAVALEKNKTRDFKSNYPVTLDDAVARLS